MSPRAGNNGGRAGNDGGAGQGGAPGPRGRGLARGLADSAFGLGTAICFSVSPVFLRFGLSEFDSPTVAVTIGLTSATIAYVLVLIIGGRLHRMHSTARPGALPYQLAAGIFIATGTWLRYIAVGMIPIAIVSTLGRMNIPVVLALSPLFLTGARERVTPRLWLGAGLIIVGAALVTLR